MRSACLTFGSLAAFDDRLSSIHTGCMVHLQFVALAVNGVLLLQMQNPRMDQFSKRTATVNGMQEVQCVILKVNRCL